MNKFLYSMILISWHRFEHFSQKVNEILSPELSGINLPNKFKTVRLHLKVNTLEKRRSYSYVVSANICRLLYSYAIIPSFLFQSNAWARMKMRSLFKILYKCDKEKFQKCYTFGIFFENAIWVDKLVQCDIPSKVIKVKHEKKIGKWKFRKLCCVTKKNSTFYFFHVALV